MQIHYAARRGDNAAIDRQLARGVPVDAYDPYDGTTALMSAAAGRPAGVATLDLLLAAGADPNAVGKPLGKTALDLSAASGSVAKVRRLLAAGANPALVNGSGYTAITGITQFHSAAHLAVLGLLLRAGSPPDVVSSYGESPLRGAIRVGNFVAVRMLIGHGASREPTGFSDLMWAIALDNAAEVESELAKDPDLTQRDYWEMTPWLLSLLKGDVEIARKLLDAGASTDVVGRCGKTPLEYAVSTGRPAMVRWLLDFGMDPNAEDEFGTTPLAAAAGSGAVESLGVLLDAGARLVSSNGDAAIESAADAATAARLVGAGADLNHVGADGYFLLKTAAEGDDFEFAKNLLAMGAAVDANSTGMTALHTAVMHDHLDIVELLLHAGADPNAIDVDGYTPLMYAGSLECVDVLLRAGAGLDYCDDVGTDVVGHHADTEIIDRLLRVGGRVNPKAGNCTSLLHRAAENGDCELVQFLVDRAANVNAQNAWGLSPLMAAAEHGHADVVRLLCANGADTDLADEDGRTAVFYAAAPEGFTAFQLAREMADTDPFQFAEEFDPAMADSLRQMEDVANLVADTFSYGYKPSDDVSALEELVRQGADVNHRDGDGGTPLLLVAGCGRPARLSALLRLGADATARFASGESAAEISKEHHDAEQSREIRRLLSRTGR